MNDTVVQSTLRQLRERARSRPLWGTFFAILVLFVLTGPYGTGEKLTFWPRLLYWSLLQGAGWIITICLSAVANAATATVLPSRIGRMMAGAVVAALPIGVVISVTNHAFFALPVDLASVIDDAFAALPLCLIFCFLSCLPGGNEQPAAMEEAPADAPFHLPVAPPCAIMTRVPPQKRGELLRLSVQDHYTEIVTTRGRQLVLLRFADALRDIGDTPGMQVHRSHWVADAGVVSLLKKAGRLFVVTHDGEEIPVSRSYNAAVQARFAAHMPAR